MTNGRLSATLSILGLITALGTAPAAQTDLDELMARVLARRDENWKKLQQYVLDERETLQLNGPDGTRLYGFRREYTWFIRDGYFIRSPLVFDGVRLGERDRARYEAEWLERERARERRAASGDPAKRQVVISPSGIAVESGEAARRERDPVTTAPSSAGEAVETARQAPAYTIDDILKPSLEPRFVSAAYFMRFKFDPGHYALMGRERLGDRDVLRIEYYPSLLFREGRTRPNRQLRERDDEVVDKMNKVSLVTLWVDPAEHQIVQYRFENMDMDFLPGRSLVRVDDLRASMRMTQPFPGVWLPGSIELGFAMTIAAGSFDARYDVEYRNYREAAVTTRIKP